MSLKIELLARILDDENIELRKSRFSAEEALYVAQREIAHFHSLNEIDVRVTRREIKRRGFANSSDARIIKTSPSSDWIVVKFSCESDLDFVQELVIAAAAANAV